MADINVDVNLPSAINVDITSPTQVLAANVSIPGPQGPRGPASNINNLSKEFLYITGQDGIIVSSNNVDIIYVSGNSGHFQSAVNSLTTNLNSTGANLNISINNLSELFTGYTGTLDATYASDIQLANTGATLQTNINTLTTNVGLTGSTLATNIATTGTTLSNNITTLTNNLASTGTTLNSKIDLFSGTYQGFVDNLDATYATDASVSAVANNLATTGSTLQTNINTLTTNVGLTGSTLATNIASTGSALQTNINNLSGYINSSSSNIVFTTGNQSVAGNKTLTNKLNITVGASNDSALKVGTLEFQPYSVNNAWLGDNTYYSGGFYRRSAGYAGAFYFQGPEGQFRFADTANAGTTYTPAVQLKTHLDGRFGVGSDISTATDNFTNSNFFVDSTDNGSFVGLGTTTPAEKLHVGGNLKLDGSYIYIYDSPNDANNNIVWADGELIFNNNYDGPNTSIVGFIFNAGPLGENVLYSNKPGAGGGYLTIPSGKNDYIALASEVVNMTGNQTISGVKTFIGNHIISGNLNVTGNSNIRGALDVTGLVVSGLGTPFILKSASNGNSVYFDPTLNGNAGILYANYVNTIGLSSIGDLNLSIGYGGGGTRDLLFTKSSINRAILDSNGNFGIGSGISSVPSRFYVSGNSVLQGDLTVSGTLTTNQRPFVNGTGVLLSGEAAQVDLSTTIRTTGNQTVSGIKDFQSIPQVSGKDIYYQKDVYYFTGNNFTPDSNIARTFEYVLTGLAGASATLNAPINMSNGENIVIKIKQSPSGSNNIIFNAAYKFPGGVSPSLTFTPSKADIYTALKIDSNFYSTYVKDFIN